jgi:hypothetical protein
MLLRMSFELQDLQYSKGGGGGGGGGGGDMMMMGC